MSRVNIAILMIEFKKGLDQKKMKKKTFPLAVTRSPLFSLTYFLPLCHQKPKIFIWLRRKIIYITIANQRLMH